MPFCRIPETDIRYALLSFDKDGKEVTTDSDGIGGIFSERLIKEARDTPPSHIFLFSHGWKGDFPSAEEQYNRWIKALVAVIPASAQGAAFKPLWLGLHWPSLPWGDEEVKGGAFGAAPGSGGMSPEETVEVYLDRLGLGAEARPLLQTIVKADQEDPAATELPPDAEKAYRELAVMAGRTGSEGPAGAPDVEGEPFNPQQSFEAGNEAAADMGAAFGGGGGLLGGILDPLRQLSFWTMKKRARTIGESGMHDVVTKLMQAAPAARFHLMGHSFGCIVVSSILGGAAGQKALPRAVDSVALVQGAVSLWSYAESILGGAAKGYFNPVLIRKGVRGPIVVTHSVFDKAVGTLYPIATASVFSNPNFGPAFGSGEKNLPKYGGIGSFGICGVKGASRLDMLAKDEAYAFAAGQIYNLESSKFIKKGDGASGAHSDIDGPEVAHAIWSAAQI